MEKELKEQVNQNVRMINHHIGLGGKAHEAVNDYNAGFMTPDQKGTLENAGGQRIAMPQGTDVFTLPAGKYEISGALNNPIGSDDKSFIEYDISTSFDGRRQIEACVSAIGRRYYRSIHSGGKPESGTKGWWFDPYTVWNGSATSGTISFNPMSEKYVGIRVRLRTLTGQSLMIDMMGTENSTYVTIPNISNDLSDLQYQLYEVELKLTNNTITIVSNRTLVVRSNSMVDGKQASIMITEVKVLSEKG